MPGFARVRAQSNLTCKKTRYDQADLHYRSMSRIHLFPQWLFLLAVVLLCGLYAVPLNDWTIEPQPDPTMPGRIISLGTVEVNTIRHGLLTVLAIPLVCAALFVLISKRFDKRQRNSGYAVLILLFGLAILSSTGFI